jgi:hypothetical protein
MTNPKIEAEINDYLNRKGIVAEQKAFMAENIEAVEHEMARNDLDHYSFTHSSGLIVKINRKAKEKAKLDKTGLAEELDVEKAELNTAGMVRLAEERTLTEHHIHKHTFKETKVEVKVKTKKPKQKE